MSLDRQLRRRITRETTKLVLGAAATAFSAYCLYKGIDSFIEVGSGADMLRETANTLQNSAEYTAEIASQARETIIAANEYLTSHLHVFPHSPNADQLAEVITQLDVIDSVSVTNSIVPELNDVARSYSGPGNCIFVKLLVPLISTGVCGIKTLSKAFRIKEDIKYS